MSDFRADSIDHVEFFVPDRHEAATWYRRTLGLTACTEYASWADHRNGPLMIATADGRSKLALFEGGPTEFGAPTQGFHRVAFRASGEGFREFVMSAATSDLRDSHGEALTALKVVDHGAALSVYFRDPWGHALELTTYDAESCRSALGIDG